jgi:DNA (cytosine-5)-methyltransferase 1
MPSHKAIEHPSGFTAVDTFCGAGGLSYGLRQAGFDIAYAFDSNPLAVETYRQNIGSHAVVADAKDVSGDAIKSLLPRSRELTLLTGGPPCQGFSIQRRGPREDVRNDLVFEFLRLVNQLQPRIFLMENVPSLAAPSNKAYYEKYLATVQSMGYRIKAAVLNAADFGVPQLRRRLFVLGTRADNPFTFTFPEPEVEPSNWRTVRDAIGELPSPTSDAAKMYAHHVPDKISDLNRERISHVPAGGGRDDIPEHLRLPCHAVPVSTAGHRGVYGRLPWDKPAGTITTKCNSFTRGRFAHPVENRNISMREAARLQSFPDDFVFAGSKVDIAHQVGNAVPPLFAQAVGRSLLKQLRGESQDNADSQLSLELT